MRYAAAFLRPDDEARPDRPMGPQPPRKSGARRHREIRNQRSRNFRNRRHQHLSRQAEADPVWLPRSRARRAKGVSLRLSRQEVAVPIHNVVYELAEKAWGGMN